MPNLFRHRIKYYIDPETSSGRQLREYMPELPEVETIKRGLNKAIIGKKIVNVDVLREKSFKGDPKEIVGKYVVGVERRAKLLIIGLGSRLDGVKATLKTLNLPENTERFLVIHLKMTGQLVYRRKLKTQNSPLRQGYAGQAKLQFPTSPRLRGAGKTTIPNFAKATLGKQNSKLSEFKGNKSPYSICELPNKYTRVIIWFDDGSKLFFNDLRVFGWIKIIKNLKLKIKNFDEVIGEKFGPEPFSKEFTVDYLKEILSKWGRPIKLLLIDQTKIAGVGNIYSNEALFCAGIAPHHRGRDLLKDHPEKVEKLYKCILKVLEMGIKYGGSTALDDAYRNIEGERGQMQQHFNVYGKAGEDCPNNCGKKIRRMKLGGRGTFFCPRCQR